MSTQPPISEQSTLSIDNAIARADADDGMPIKLAKNVKPGDVLILDWPAWILAEVMFTHAETTEGSGVTTRRWQVRSPDHKDTAFVIRGDHEYVRVQGRVS